jgi:cysteine synthase B
MIDLEYVNKENQTIRIKRNDIPEITRICQDGVIYLRMPLKLKNPDIKIVGAQPAEGSQIAGIRKWPEAYLPAIYDPSVVDQFELIEQKDAEAMARRLAAEEGICAGVSAAGALVAALRVAQQARNATIAFIVCDRGDRYLSTGLFDEQA